MTARLLFCLHIHVTVRQPCHGALVGVSAGCLLRVTPSSLLEKSQGQPLSGTFQLQATSASARRYIHVLLQLPRSPGPALSCWGEKRDRRTEMATYRWWRARVNCMAGWEGTAGGKAGGREGGRSSASEMLVRPSCRWC